MERRLAIIITASGALTLLTATAALASLGGFDLFGSGDEVAATGVVLVTTPATSTATSAVDGGATTLPTTVTGEVAPLEVVLTVPGATPAAPATPAPNAPPAATTPGVTTPAATQPGATTPPTPTTTATTTPAAPGTTRPPTTTTRPTTTTAAPTGTTLPPDARIPSDWPPDKPIPPIPAGCKKPVLEDNGVWNCQH